MESIRDFTKKTLEDFEKFMDKYFDSGENEASSWWNRFLYHMGAYDISGTADGDYKKYIKSLSKVRFEAESKIIRVWENVADEEQIYLGKFNQMSSFFDSSVRIANELTKCINTNNLENPIDYSQVMLRISDDYLNSLELRVQEILEKDVSEWTDEELEIISYVYLTTNDEELRNEIINEFYTSTQYYDNVQLPDGYSFYVRDEEAWKKFECLIEYYFANIYQQYLNGQCTEEEINRAIENMLLINYLSDKKNNLLFCLDDEKPIRISSDGTVEYDLPNMQTLFLETSTLRKDDFDKKQNLFCINNCRIHQTYDSSVRIENGEEAGHMIAEDISADSVTSSQYDWEKFAKKLMKKTTKKAAEIILPGSGKVVDKLLGIGETIIDINETPDKKIYDRAYYEEYVGWFQMKCVSTSDGYMILATPETQEVVAKLMEWLEVNKTRYPNLYESYYPQACYDGYGDTNDPTNFYSNLDIGEFCRAVHSSGALEELDRAGIF